LLKWAQMRVSYEPWPNLFLEVEGRLRQVESELESLETRNLYLGAGLRYHFQQKTSIF